MLHYSYRLYMYVFFSYIIVVEDSYLDLEYEH